MEAPDPGQNAQSSHAERGELWQQLDPAGAAEAFLEAWLGLQCGLLPGSRRGLLLLGDVARSSFAPAATWPKGQPAPGYLLEAAEKALGEGRPLVLPDARASGRTDSLAGAILALPVQATGQLRGVVVLEVSPRPLPELQALLPHLRWGGGWLEAYFRRDDASTETAARTRFETAMGVLAATLEHDSFQGAAATLTTELSTELGCDRAAVGFVRHGRMRLRALSHSADFGKKTNLVRGLEAAMNEVLDLEDSIVFPEAKGALPEAIPAHEELARLHEAGSICSVPLVHGDRICGVLVLERSEGRPFDRATVDLCQAIGALCGPPLDLLRREDRWPTTKVFESGGRLLGRLFGPHHVALKLATVALCALVAFLTFARGDYRLTADAVLEPAIQLAAVAPFEGYIAEAPARPGDLVQKGQLLGSLDDRDLHLELFKWQSEHQQHVRQYRQAMAERDAAAAEVLAASIAEARAQLERIEDRLARTRLLAPFDGVVVTGDHSQELGAPVERGQVLFEVAPLETYRIVLLVDERDVAQVALEQRGRLVLASLPEEPILFEVEKITPVSAAAEGRNTFRVEASPLGATRQLRPGVEGVGKIEVDRRRLIWIWSHRALDWLRLKTWSWMP